MPRLTAPPPVAADLLFPQPAIASLGALPLLTDYNSDSFFIQQLAKPLAEMPGASPHSYNGVITADFRTQPRVVLYHILVEVYGELRGSIETPAGHCHMHG